MGEKSRKLDAAHCADVSRREFLNYIFGAVLLTSGVGICGAAACFYQPRAKLGVDIFLVNAVDFPLLDSLPRYFPDGNFWLNRVGQGMLVFDARCPFDEIKYKWVNTNQRFECPHCGKKYSQDGVYEGPSNTRDLDQLAVEVKSISGSTTRFERGGPIPVDTATSLVVDIRRNILGRNRN